MRRRYNLAHFLLASTVVLGLTLLMVWVDTQAQIAFASQRAGNAEIYVMDADGGNPQNLTNNDVSPAWFKSSFSVSMRAKSLQCGGGSNRSTDKHSSPPSTRVRLPGNQHSQLSNTR